MADPTEIALRPQADKQQINQIFSLQSETKILTGSARYVRAFIITVRCSSLFVTNIQVKKVPTCAFVYNRTLLTSSKTISNLSIKIVKVYQCNGLIMFNIIINRNIATLSKDILSSIFSIQRNHVKFSNLRWNHANKNSSIPVKRPPVVTIMGHVDHGKTTLLDHLRNSQIVKQEFGGITQHIGAFVVPFKKEKNKELVTFLDTPGHAAFASMRRRGANVTDIVVLVVACDDGVLDQTVESIKYAKESNVPMIVAVNKIDRVKDDKELNKLLKNLRDQLIVQDVICEPDGGDIQLVKISALRGTGVDDLKEAILALAETLELKAEVDCMASGRIIESKLDPHRGKLCTVLVQKGILSKGDSIIAGYNWAKIRALFDERNQLQQSCGPGLPIQVIGWREEDLPSAGDEILQVPSEQEARKIITGLKEDRLKQKAQRDAKEAQSRYESHMEVYRKKLAEKLESGHKYRATLWESRTKRTKESRFDQDEMDKKINLIVKCDVDGSLEALLELLDTYDKNGKQLVKLDIMHCGVGNITEGDLSLAQSFPNSVIYGFNVKPENQNIFVKAKKSGVGLKMFNVIYHLIDDLKGRIGEKLPFLEEKITLASAHVIQEFIVTEGKKKVHVAGCRCTKGSLNRDVLYRLIRNNEILVEDLKVYTLRHLKENVKQVEKEQECGISFSEHQLEFRAGDVLEAYEIRKFKPKLKWALQGFD